MEKTEPVVALGELATGGGREAVDAHGAAASDVLARCSDCDRERADDPEYELIMPIARCSACGKVFCNAHKRAHAVRRGHDASITLVGVGDDGGRCPFHPELPVIALCTVDNTVVCGECVRLSHPGHPLVDLAAAAPGIRGQARVLLRARGCGACLIVCDCR